MRKGIFRKVAAAGLALMMLIALAPGMGLTSSTNVIITYIPNVPGSREAPRIEYAAIGNSYTVRKNPFTNPGNTFISWSTQPDGTGTRYAPGKTITVNAPLTLYAQWKNTATGTVTITYKYNSAIDGDFQPDVTDTVKIGSAYMIRTYPFAGFSHNTFIGWNAQANGAGAQYVPGKIITVNCNLTLYACWLYGIPQRVTVTYKANANDSQADWTDHIDYYSTYYGLPYKIRDNLFTRPGYSFTGWNTRADGSGNSFKAGQEVVSPKTFQVLYAQWSLLPPATITVTYNRNYIGCPPDTIDTILKGSSYIVRLNPPPTRPGYTFVGWSTSPHGIVVDLVITFDSDIILYAIWKPDPVTTDVPTPVDGRILPAAIAGDTSDWVEIARNGGYSLIIRRTSVNSVIYGSSNVYAASNARKAINDFFNDTEPDVSKQYETLPYNANLRNYTVQSNALSNVGTTCATESMYDGYSKPTGIRAIAGEDVMFALSFTEAANFCSRYRYFCYEPYSVYADVIIYPYIYVTSAIANYNFNKLHQINQPIWLRSPGIRPDMAGAITQAGLNQLGSVYMDYNTAKGLAQPAVWVDDAIFNKEF